MRECEEVGDDRDETKKKASLDDGPLGFSMICKMTFDQSNGHMWIECKPRLPMVKKRLTAKGIITRMESRIKNKENCQFKSRALVQHLKVSEEGYGRLNNSRSRKDAKCLKHEQEKHHTALGETP